MVNGGTYSYEYHLKDHLGNTRVAYSDANSDGFIDEDEILQVTDYYPFGMRHEIEGYPNHANQKYLYNGKELQEETGWYDYGARMYDAALGRFHTVDNYAEKYVSLNPYQYTANNPINFIDYNGDYILMHDDNGVAFWYENGKAYWTEKDEDGNTVKGDEYKEVDKNDAIKQTVSDLSKIEETGYGNRMVDDLVGSDKATSITFDQGFSDRRPGYFQGTLTTSAIRYQDLDRLVDGVRSSETFITLGHEIAHAWANQFAPDYSWYDTRQGDLLTSTNAAPNTQKLKAERFAMRFENYLRAMNGESTMRVRYGGQVNLSRFRRYNPTYFKENPLPKSYMHIKPKNAPVNPIYFYPPDVSWPK